MMKNLMILGLCLGAAVFASTPAIADDEVLVVCTNGQTFYIDYQQSKIRWSDGSYPAEITDNTITWQTQQGYSYTLNRITGDFSKCCFRLLNGSYVTHTYSCQQGEKKF